MLVYLAELAAHPQDEWSPFFEFFSPRPFDEGPVAHRIVWGEDCRGRRHFDAAGLVNWCFEQAVDARYAIDFDFTTWGTDASGTIPVPLTDPPCPGDVVVADQPLPGAEIGILVGEVSGRGEVVQAAGTSVGVLRRPFLPDNWTRRRRPTRRAAA